MRCGKVIPAQLLYLRRNHRNVERGSCKLFLAGALPCLFCQAKPNAHTQISDEDRQHDQPECEGIEHGFEKESFNQPFRTYIQPWQTNMQYVEPGCSRLIFGADVYHEAEPYWLPDVISATNPV